ncbi:MULTISPECIES: TetR/AcrR family transcriptional regulator [Bacillus]|uniref:HTH tetR-type domain-containing protein n=2 Tax=Bacillus TaxID=1386 RepID=A0A0M4GAN1_9BACI|nr:MULTISPECIES: TetR/AcrR family transcriptional regulator [Bacillus]ALC82615.1 hypothetical protein AM592_14285 [Bacillus gobiensis]MBP1081548.1 AcrR family transcriptional regulator [Bacillus capparidis]MED1096213.1 TetR/AcrR family transcriptional regulator [Bacillus capparidis]
MEKTLRQIQAEETRNKLLTAALKLFSQKGFKESTVKEIGKAAGVTDGLIYHYFKSKDELLSAVLEKYTVNRSLKDSLPDFNEEQTLHEQLTIYFKLMFKYLRMRQDFIVMCFSEAQRNPKIHEKLLEIIQQGCNQLEEFIIGRTDKKIDQVTIQNLVTSFFLYFIMWGRFCEDDTAINYHLEQSIKDFLKTIK